MWKERKMFKRRHEDSESKASRLKRAKSEESKELLESSSGLHEAEFKDTAGTTLVRKELGNAHLDDEKNHDKIRKFPQYAESIAKALKELNSAYQEFYECYGHPEDYGRYLQEDFNELCKHAQYAEKLASAFSQLFPRENATYIRTPKIRHILYQKAEYAETLARAFVKLGEAGLLPQRKGSGKILLFFIPAEYETALYNHPEHAEKLARALAYLKDDPCFFSREDSYRNRMNLYEHAQYAEELASAFLDLHRAGISQPHIHKAIFLYARYAKGLASAFLMLHEAEIPITSEIINTLHQQADHAEEEAKKLKEKLDKALIWLKKDRYLFTDDNKNVFRRCILYVDNVIDALCALKQAQIPVMQEHFDILCKQKQRGGDMAIALSRLHQVGILTRENFDLIRGYTSCIHTIAGKLAVLQQQNNLNQASFNHVLYTEQVIAFGMGMHPRLGQRSLIWKFFGSQGGISNHIIGDVEPIKKIVMKKFLNPSFTR